MKFTVARNNKVFISTDDFEQKRNMFTCMKNCGDMVVAVCLEIVEGKANVCVRAEKLSYRKLLLQVSTSIRLEKNKKIKLCPQGKLMEMKVCPNNEVQAIYKDGTDVRWNDDYNKEYEFAIVL